MLRLQSVCVTGAWAGGRAGDPAKWAQGQKGDGPGQAERVTQMDLAGFERRACPGSAGTQQDVPTADGRRCSSGDPSKGVLFCRLI